MKLDKTKMKDSMGRYLTQSMFLELGYNTEFAMFTLDDEDKTYDGKLYPSIKKLFIEFGDVTCYLFSKEYLLGWNHWKRLEENKAIRHHIDQWKEELALTVQAEGIRSIVDIAIDKDSFAAAQWLAKRGWIEKKAGRPSKEQIEADKRSDARLKEDYLKDVNSLIKFKG